MLDYELIFTQKFLAKLFSQPCKKAVTWLGSGAYSLFLYAACIFSLGHAISWGNCLLMHFKCLSLVVFCF